MARSVAILLMLEGHCTGAALADQYRNQEYLAYDIWYHIHGWTSPLFFTVSGVIFTYLLSAHNEFYFWKNVRVRKGFKRVLQLLFWGYLIQVNLRSIYNYYVNGVPYNMEWMQAFHVLQAIGFGILGLLLTYGAFKWIGKISLHWYYFIAGAAIFGISGWLNNRMQIDSFLIHEGVDHARRYVPHGAPSFIQNMFYGQYSEFSIIRYTGYTLWGGMIGSVIRKYEHNVFKPTFIFSFTGIGLLFLTCSRYILQAIDWLCLNAHIIDARIQETNTYPFKGLGVILMFISFLMIIDKYMDLKDNLFLKIGRNTLSVYIVHVIILYEGIFGFGLKPMLLHRNFDPLWSTVISAAFIAIFLLMVKYIEPLTKWYYKVVPIHWLN